MERLLWGRDVLAVRTSYGSHLNLVLYDRSGFMCPITRPFDLHCYITHLLAFNGNNLYKSNLNLYLMPVESLLLESLCVRFIDVATFTTP